MNEDYIYIYTYIYIYIYIYSTCIVLMGIKFISYEIQLTTRFKICQVNNSESQLEKGVGSLRLVMVSSIMVWHLRYKVQTVVQYLSYCLLMLDWELLDRFWWHFVCILCCCKLIWSHSYYRVSVKSFPDYIHLLQENYRMWNTNIFFNVTQQVFLQHISTLQHVLLLLHGEHLINSQFLSMRSPTHLQLL